MTPAELKTIRESLGLSINWIAEQFNVSIRSAQYWESGERSVPADVSEMLESLDRLIDEYVDDTVDLVQELIDSGERPNQVNLIRYRTDKDLQKYLPDMAAFPATTHAAMLYRIRKELSYIDIKTRIVYLDSADYEAWRSACSLENSEQTRSQWASIRSTD